MIPSATEPPNKKKSTEQLLALLGAFCLFLSLIEYLFPRPIPILRLGLANLPLLLALRLFSFKDFMVLTALKVLGQALVNGTLVSHVFIFSLAGSFSSALFMYSLHANLKKYFSLLGLSLAGAMMSNIIQLGAAVLFIYGSSSIVIAPLFFLVGVVSGVFLGWVAEVFSKRSLWYWNQRKLYDKG